MVVVENGWIIAKYKGPENTPVYMSLDTEGEHWIPAFVDFRNGERVAKIRVRHGEGRCRVWVKVNGVKEHVGHATI